MKNIIIVALLSLFLFCSCHTVVGNWLKEYADNRLTYGEEYAHQGRFRVDGCYIYGPTEKLDSVCKWGIFFIQMGYVQNLALIKLKEIMVE